jgi:hypothetical protein
VVSWRRWSLAGNDILLPHDLISRMGQLTLNGLEIESFSSSIQFRTMKLVEYFQLGVLDGGKYLYDSKTFDLRFAITFILESRVAFGQLS